jgi:sugar phosphate isomerase/epimerase
MAITRRDFVISSIAFAGATAILGNAANEKTPIGVQLYTVREQLAKDLPGTLASIRKIGYQEVETYWDVYSHPAPELKKIINDNGLQVRSGHFNYDGLDSKFDYAKELGVHYVICPMLPKDMWTSADGFKKAAVQLNTWGERAKKMGLQFGFHNHNYEFRQFGDQTGFDLLMKGTDPGLVCLEMDCYWMTQAGKDPVKMMNRLGKRVQLLHLKDRKAGFPPSQEMNAAAEHFAPVGRGSIDWKAIIGAAKSHGIERFYAEQDTSELPPLEDLTISYQSLQKLL